MDIVSTIKVWRKRDKIFFTHDKFAKHGELVVMEVSVEKIKSSQDSFSVISKEIIGKGFVTNGYEVQAIANEACRLAKS